MAPQQSRVYRDGGGSLLKFSRGGNPAKVEREFRFLLALNASPYFPEPLGFGPEWMVMMDLGEPEPITDMEKVAKHGCLLLRDLKAAKIRHNDLIAPNIIIRDNIPYAVDFGWSRWEQEPRLACIDDTVMLPHTLQTLWQLSRALSRLGLAA
jgi:hypothetical protein